MSCPRADRSGQASQVGAEVDAEVGAEVAAGADAGLGFEPAPGVDAETGAGGPLGERPLLATVCGVEEGLLTMEAAACSTGIEPTVGAAAAHLAVDDNAAGPWPVTLVAIFAIDTRG